jgi:ATP-binding cassette subfamily C (CFTR/MRP) protein 1
LDPAEGTVQVDGLDITQIPIDALRDRLICIPQDPVIFAKTFLFNLDPENQTSDQNLINIVLDLVGLSELVNERGGLSAQLNPATMSLGEQQLLVLARSILRKRTSSGRCVLILDEATSSMDSRLQTKIKEVVAMEFRDSTVITIAHRLELIRDCDQVLVMENGGVSKLGVPGDILGDG